MSRCDAGAVTGIKGGGDRAVALPGKGWRGARGRRCTAAAGGVGGRGIQRTSPPGLVSQLTFAVNF